MTVRVCATRCRRWQSASFLSHGILLRGLLAAAVIAGVTGLKAFAQTGMLETIREDVSSGVAGGSAPASESESAADRDRRQRYEDFDAANGSISRATNAAWNAASDQTTLPGFVLVGGLVVTAPIWVPHALVRDDFTDPSGYHPFPYDEPPLLTATTDWPDLRRPLTVRLDVDYLDTFDHLESVNGRLLVDTSSRFGMDASWNHFEEHFGHRRRDQSDLGDFNVVYRFAQSQGAQFRAGLGLNWISEPGCNDLGFNFTYGADLFPREPWVLSATLDCGTLGESGLFRFRTTAGVVIRGIEAYAGYEYTDIGRTRWNALIAGLSVWF